VLTTAVDPVTKNGLWTMLPSVVPPVKTNYVFLGYYDAKTDGYQYYDKDGVYNGTLHKSGGRMLYAQWRHGTYTISYDLNGGTGGPDPASTILKQSDAAIVPTAVPTREYFDFAGWNTAENGTGTAYAPGAPFPSQLDGATITLYAQWSKRSVTGVSISITYGDDSNTMTDDTLKAEVVPSEAANSVNYQWYRAGEVIGNATAATYTPTTDDQGLDITVTVTGTGLYESPAKSSAAVHINYVIYTITYLGMDGAVNSEANLGTRVHGTQATISSPTKEGYVFMGWKRSDSSPLELNPVIGDTDDENKNITLTAVWEKPKDAGVVAEEVAVQGVVSNTDAVAEQLLRLFDEEYRVDDPTRGVTDADLEGVGTGKTVRITLTVRKLDYENDADKAQIDAIGTVAQGAPLTYYDLSIVKTVTVVGSAPVSTAITELPFPIEVVIPTTTNEDLSDAAPTYEVYRVHGTNPDNDQVLNAEKLPVGEREGEYYDVVGSNIIINTDKFSTYSIAGTINTINSQNTGGSTEFKSGSHGWDVQGKINTVEPGKVYKVDLTWGAMAFVFSTQIEWLPDIHMYTEGSANAWQATSFEGGNNAISALNHSNAAVDVSFAIDPNTPTAENAPDDFSGVDIWLKKFNEKSSVDAETFTLEAAPVGSPDSALVPCTAYLWLDGPPKKEWIEAEANKTFTNVARIVVTVAPHVTVAEEPATLALI